MSFEYQFNTNYGKVQITTDRHHMSTDYKNLTAFIEDHRSDIVGKLNGQSPAGLHVSSVSYRGRKLNLGK